MRVADGWHVYANPVGDDKLVESQTVVTLSADGVDQKVPVAYPKGREHKDVARDRYNVYEGEATLVATVDAPRDAKIEARVKVIACKDGRCLLPSVLKVK